MKTKMAYDIMLSCPSDVRYEKKIFFEAVNKWNSNHVKNKITLIPKYWEKDCLPIAGKGSQKIINEGILKEADILVVVFRTRLGTPTKNSPSGTVEEIKLFKKAGKIVTIFLYKGLINQSVAKPGIENRQYKKLLQFINENDTYNGIYKEYKSHADFKTKFDDYLQQLMETINRGNISKRTKYGQVMSSVSKVNENKKVTKKLTIKTNDNRESSIHKYLLKKLGYIGEDIFPIPNKININLLSISILKKYIAKNYIKEPQNVDILENAIFDNFDKLDNPCYFEGYISASLCFLYNIEKALKDMKDSVNSGFIEYFLFSTTLITLLGTYNKAQRPPALINFKVSKFKEDKKYNKHWTINLKDEPKELLDILRDFCPPKLSKYFYLAWNSFCCLLLSSINVRTVKERNLLNLLKILKYKVLNSLDMCLDEYLLKYHNEKYVFWICMVDTFIRHELKIEGYKEIELELEFINKNEIKNGRITWQELTKKNLNYTNSDKRTIKNIISIFNDEEKGIKTAVNFLFMRV